MSFGAVDDSPQPGSYGASANGSGSSWIIVDEEHMTVRVRLLAGYFPSLFPGGDNPGGTAEAELSSVVEFLMPGDEVIWGYQLRIGDTDQFSGSVNVLFENVTQGETLFNLTSQVYPPIEGVLTAQAGDLMRITSAMFGSGNTNGPAGTRKYDADFSATFIIPEPTTWCLLLPTALLLLARRPR